MGQNFGGTRTKASITGQPTEAYAVRFLDRPIVKGQSSPSRGWKLLPSASFGWLVDREM